MEQFYRDLIARRRSLVTTNYVIAELVALLTTRSRFTRPQLINIVNRIRQIPRLQIVHIDKSLDSRAWSLLEQYQDKDWSQVDAASFLVMRDNGITETFTIDHHFTQAGFIRRP
jgi:predicted nucleic acid-binding protein